MKKRIIIGSLLAVFLMISLPSASAVESNTVKETIETPYPILIPEIDVVELEEKYKDNPVEPTFILLFILINLLKILRGFKFAVLTVLLGIIIAIIRSVLNRTAVIIS